MEKILRTHFFAGLVLCSALVLAQGMDPGNSRYGGPVYNGAPALSVTASVVRAGGGPGHFSSAKAITSLLGAKTAKAEVAKLTKQYGATDMQTWLKVGDYAVADALKRATFAGVKLPKPTMSGHKLAATLVEAGQDSDGTFYTEFMLDKALSHKIHMAVMDDIDAKYGEPADALYHRISNQAYYDAGKALGVPNVKLAKFH